MIDPRARAVLDFWFAETRERPQDIPERIEFWFGSGEDPDAVRHLDRDITARFGELVEAAGRGDLDAWADDPHTRLALILLIDQFRRNAHRGTAAAFALDRRALELTLTGLDRMLDQLAPIEQVFFLMPLQHAEDLAIQQQSVAAYDRLQARVDAPLREAFASFAEYAVMHRDIVACFGRFPHRNAVLGRASTAAEREYLAGEAPTFGQS